MQISHSHCYPDTQEVPHFTFACLGVAHSSFGAGSEAFAGDEKGAWRRVGRGAQVTGEGLASILGHSVWLSLHTAAAHCCESKGNITSSTVIHRNKLGTPPGEHLRCRYRYISKRDEKIKIRTPTCCKAGLGSGGGACTVTPISHQRGGEPNQTIVDAKVHKVPDFRINIPQECALHRSTEMQDNAKCSQVNLRINKSIKFSKMQHAIMQGDAMHISIGVTAYHCFTATGAIIFKALPVHLTPTYCLLSSVGKS